MLVEHVERPFCVKEVSKKGSACEAFVILRGARRESSGYRKGGGNGRLCGDELRDNVEDYLNCHEIWRTLVIWKFSRCFWTSAKAENQSLINSGS